jgi:hypothetical protein
LPDLKGKWLTAYSAVWAIMLPLALIGAALRADRKPLAADRAQTRRAREREKLKRANDAHLGARAPIIVECDGAAVPLDGETQDWREAGILQLAEGGSQRQARIAVLSALRKEQQPLVSVKPTYLRRCSERHPPQVVPAAQARSPTSGRIAWIL